MAAQRTDIQPKMQTKRLGPMDQDLAKRLFVTMAEVFGEASRPLTDGYLRRLLGREDFWAIAAFADDEIVGGLTAHTLPLITSESSEIFIYDVAVRNDHQGKGIGKELVSALRAAAAEAGIHEAFVAADNDDVRALGFYRALGGAGSPVTLFTFSGRNV